MQTPPWTLRPAGPATPADCPAPELTEVMRDVVCDAARVHCLYDQATWTEGPAWWTSRDTLVFSDVVGRRVLTWHPDGSVRTLLDPSEFTNGNAAEATGALVHCEHGRRAISRTCPGEGTTVLVDAYAGRRLNSPNDLTVARDGAIWFTDPVFGLTQPTEGYPAEPEQPETNVYRFDPGSGEITAAAALDQPNGLAFAPDESILYVSQTPPGGDVQIVAFDHDPSTHDLRNPRQFATVENGLPDGFTVDERGWLWSGSDGAVEIFDPPGERIGRVPVPATVSNCTFDTTGRRLFITGASYLWLLDLDGAG